MSDKRTMPYLLLIIFTMAPAFAEWQTSAELRSLVSELRRSVNPNDLQCLQRGALEDLGALNRIPQGMGLPGSPTPASVCGDVRRYCQSEFGRPQCASSGDARERLASPEFARAATQLFRRQFQDLKNSNQALNICCSSNQTCRNYMQSVRLQIVPRAAPGRAPNFFRDKLVQLSLTTLLSCQDRGCVEEIMLHELGHACNAALLTVASARNTSTESCNGLMLSASALAGRFGARARDCVVAEVRRQAQASRRSNVCKEKWFDEGFASVIYRDMMTSKLHYQRHCTSNVADDAHPAMRPLISCARP